MLLWDKRFTWRELIMWGQFTMIGGFLLLVPVMYSALGNGPEILHNNFLRGFLTGLGSTSMGLSIVLNVRGMLKRREESLEQ